MQSSRMVWAAALVIALSSRVASVPTPDPTITRRIDALVAAFVADAAAMPLHWIYDTNAIADILAAGNTSDPAFFPVSHAP